MKNKFLTIASIVTMLLMTTSCGMFSNAIPELTEEDEALVVEYASKTLLKYDASNGDRLGNKPDDFEIIQEPEPTPETEWIEPESNEIVEEKSDIVNSEVNIIDNTDTSSFSAQDLEKAFELDDQIDLVYEGYEIKEAYPDNLDSYFIMNASNGCHLLIIKFSIVNITDSALDVDMGDIGNKFKISLNGNSKNALTTMLVNDLTYYKEQLEAGESDEVVVVGEYNDDELVSIDSLSLILKSENGNKTINLE